MSINSFISSALSAVDLKNRISVPADFRAVLAARPGDGKEILLEEDIERGCIMGFDGGYLERVLAEAAHAHADTLGMAHHAYVRDRLMALERVKLDEPGRVVIDTDLLAGAGIDKVALFTGAFESFEIWDPYRFYRHTTSVKARNTVVRLLKRKGLALPEQVGPEEALAEEGAA